MLNGLTQLNVELTSTCDKQTLCAFCGHQDPTISPTLKYGQMRESLLSAISREVEPLGYGLTVQFHRDGDPLAYPHVKKALALFEGHIRSIVTHGEALGRKASELIDNCEAVTVSVFRGDPDRSIQLSSIRSFLEQKGSRLPRLLIKVVGDMSIEELDEYRALNVQIINRLIHVPTGNDKYAHRLPTIPEHGLCLDRIAAIMWRSLRHNTCAKLKVC